MPRKILIVDDMASVRMLVKNLLRSEGFLLEEAQNGREAVAKALATPPPDLVLLDIIMPEMDGIQACQLIKSKHKEVPIVMLTTKGEEKHMEEARAVGADAYLTKPVDGPTLLATIRLHFKK